MMENDKMKEKFGELVRLIKIYAEKHPGEEILPGLDTNNPMFKMLISNFENIKDRVDFRIMGMMGEQMPNDIIDDIIADLRGRLGTDADIVKTNNITKEIEEKEKDYNELPTAQNHEALLEAIDRQLKNKELSMKEIDDLLDKRMQIQNIISSK